MSARDESQSGADGGRIADLIKQHTSEILADWQATQSSRGTLTESTVRSQCVEFLGLLEQSLRAAPTSVDSPEWNRAKEFLAGLSRSRAMQGFSPTETAMFVFAVKAPIFKAVRAAAGSDGGRLGSDLVALTRILDTLGLYTTEIYLRGREEVIRRQEQDALELSTPVVMLWDGILALPMIGTLDSARTQVAMETLLQRIVDTGAEIAILDITGVPTVDTLTAQHLLKTVTAARLMGAECIISGIRPQIAQTIVHLGVDLGDVVTKATLADAFKVALARTARMVVRASGAARVDNVPAPASLPGTTR